MPVRNHESSRSGHPASRRLRGPGLRAPHPRAGDPARAPRPPLPRLLPFEGHGSFPCHRLAVTASFQVVSNWFSCKIPCNLRAALKIMRPLMLCRVRWELELNSKADGSGSSAGFERRGLRTGFAERRSHVGKRSPRFVAMQRGGPAATLPNCVITPNRTPLETADPFGGASSPHYVTDSLPSPVPCGRGSAA